MFLSKYSSLISTSTIDLRRPTHRPSIIDLRRSTHRSSEGRHIDLRRSTHRSPKVDTSIFEGRHIVTLIIYLRKAIHRSSKVATSIFESRHIDFRRSKAETSHLQHRLRKMIFLYFCTSLTISACRRCTNIEVSWKKYRGAPAPGAPVLPTPMYNSPPNIVHNCPPSP